jgi:hypothetical protein
MHVLLVVRNPEQLTPLGLSPKVNWHEQPLRFHLPAKHFLPQLLVKNPLMEGVLVDDEQVRPGAAAQELAKSPSNSIPAQSRTIRRSKLVRPKSVESVSRANDESVAGVSSPGSRRSKQPSRASSAMRFR